MLIQFVLMDGSCESYPKSNANQEKCMKQIIAFGFENNDSFDDDILNSTKCYLPFNDCMYSAFETLALEPLARARGIEGEALADDACR